MRDSAIKSSRAVALSWVSGLVQFQCIIINYELKHVSLCIYMVCNSSVDIFGYFVPATKHFIFFWIRSLGDYSSRIGEKLMRVHSKIVHFQFLFSHAYIHKSIHLGFHGHVSTGLV